MRILPFFAMVLACFAFLPGAHAEPAQVGQLVIEGPWTRATPGGAKVGAGYLSIVNTGAEPDRLIAVASPIAERVEIHTMTMENGVMRMRKLDQGLELKPRAVTQLRPGGYHIMFIGLKQPIKQGEELPVQLEFANAGKIDLIMTAAAIGATQSPHESGPGPAGGSSSGHGGSASGVPVQGSHGAEPPHRQTQGSH